MRRSHLRRTLVIAYVGAVGAFLVAPTLIVIAMSFGSTRSLTFPPEGFSLQWYRAFDSAQWLDPTLTSLKVAALASLVATAFGTAAALGVVRGRFPGRQLVQALLVAPLIVPVVIIAIGLYFAFTRWQLAGTLPGLVLGHAILGIPFVFLTVGASLRAVDPVYERAAANLGAGPLSTFVRVTLPLILPGVLAGALFAFVTSLDEVVVAIFLTSPTVSTLPVEIWASLRDYIDPTVAAISSMLFMVTLVMLGLSFLIGRRQTARA